jgi:hypothetical protein
LGARIGSGSFQRQSRTKQHEAQQKRTLDWWFPNENLDAESIAYEMLFGGAAEISYARKVGAEAWFEFRGVERHEIQEQAYQPEPEVWKSVARSGRPAEMDHETDKDND